MPRFWVCMLGSILMSHAAANAAAPPAPGQPMLADYFCAEVQRRADACLASVRSLDEWQARRGEYRRQLFDMLGLDPLPARTPLEATVTGTVEHDEFRVERLHFQSQPRLYVTANVYVPKHVPGPWPAVLYLCGHARVAQDGTSFGNKVAYQQHPAWFARNGYLCLAIDSLQLGEIEGVHHGTYSENMWWWVNRGYTPAGVEAWNCIRALDYLETRPDVDRARLGVTGRSGGGAYSWWIAALDERIQCAVPVAGITDLEDHVVHGCVEGHCDCMYFLNAQGWDFPLVAALVAPRPLLISNTDRDPIFPLNGVVRLYNKVLPIYELYGARNQLALNITAGAHVDTQELQVHAFRWFQQHLRQDAESRIEGTGETYFSPEQLRVFAALPESSRNRQIHESFVPAAAAPTLPADAAAWARERAALREALRSKVFAGWPAADPAPQLRSVADITQDALRLRIFEFDVVPAFRFPLYVVHDAALETPELMVLNVLDEAGWSDFLAMLRPAFGESLPARDAPAGDADRYQQQRSMLLKFPWVMAYFAPRGIGPTAWDADAKSQNQIERRFYLLGQTLDSLRVYDIRAALRAARQVEPLRETPLWLQGERRMAANALYAALFEPGLARLDLHDLPATHDQGPYYPNIARVLELPQAVALAAETARLVLYTADAAAWSYPRAVAERLGWPDKQLQLRVTSPEPPAANQ